ncbi:MAG TPA: putative phage tail protein [Bradyrhizobium sp.]|nr:putative phage tail protein [Bradyrhizobium sp.]
MGRQPNSLEDYTAAVLSLFPRGRVWPRDPNALFPRLATAIAASFRRVDVAALGLLVDAFPATAVNLLPEWEQSLGLPDPCAGPSATLQQRQGLVVARFAGTGGQSVAYYVQYAANLGYPISIAQYAPFRCGMGRTGQPLLGAAWAYAWRVTLPLEGALTYFRTGRSAVGEPLLSFNHSILECALQEIKPAHTTLLFSYTTGDGSGILEDTVGGIVFDTGGGVVTTS